MPQDNYLSRRQLLGAAGLGAIAMHNNAGANAAAPAFELEEVTAAELQKAMASGQHTAEQIAQLYLGRIEHIDRSGPHLNSVIELNPDALAIARNLDAERKAGKVRGPLHGIPILIKDNICTADRMETTAGSLSLVLTMYHISAVDFALLFPCQLKPKRYVL